MCVSLSECESYFSLSPSRELRNGSSGSCVASAANGSVGRLAARCCLSVAEGLSLRLEGGCLGELPLGASTSCLSMLM